MEFHIKHYQRQSNEREPGQKDALYGTYLDQDHIELTLGHPISVEDDFLWFSLIVSLVELQEE